MKPHDIRNTKMPEKNKLSKNRHLVIFGQKNPKTDTVLLVKHIILIDSRIFALCIT